MPMRVQVIWTGDQAVGGGVSQLFFQGVDADAQSQVDAVQDFLDALQPTISAGTRYRIDPEVARFNPADGNLVALNPVTVEPEKPGLNNSSALPRSTQGLIRWRTGSIVNNRTVQGRFFVPGMVINNNQTPGIPTAGFTGPAQAAANLLVADPSAQLAVWSRPRPGFLGSEHTVVSASVWTEWAVLRSRRD